MFKRRMLAAIILIFGFWIALMFWLLPYINFEAMSDEIKIVIIVGIIGIVPTALILVSAFMIMRGLEKKYAVSPDKQKFIAFGAVLLRMNGESHKMFKLRSISRGKAKMMLRDWWGIKDSVEAMKVAHYLSNGSGHTPFADDIYVNLLKKGQVSPSQPFDLRYIKQEHAQQTDRIERALRAFEQARKMLLKLGYTEAELAAVNTTAAWDFGRTAYIARYSANVGYLTEDEAWIYIKAAADNAAKIYNSWREYLAAYIIGRATGYGDNSSDLTEHLKFFIGNSKSPFNEIPFK